MIFCFYVCTVYMCHLTLPCKAWNVQWQLSVCLSVCLSHVLHLNDFYYPVAVSHSFPYIKDFGEILMG